MSDYLNKTGVPNIENTIFRRLQNKFNHIPSQPLNTYIPPNNSQDSLYSIKNSNNISELYFNNNQLTSGGIIGSNVWEVDNNDNTQVITLNNKNVSLQGLELRDVSNIIFSNHSATTTTKQLYTIDDNGTTKLYFGDVQLDSPHTQALWSIVNGKLTPNGNYNINMEVGGTRHDIENVLGLTAETISLIGSTRTITNIDGLTFNGLSTYISNLKTITFTSSSTINSLTTLNTTTANTTTTNATNIFTTNITTDNLLGGKSDGIRNYLEMPNNHYIITREIQNNNGTNDAKIYSDEYYIGTPNSNQSLNDYIVSRIGTQSNQTYANFWVYPQPISYLELDLKDGNTDNKSGLKTDILIVENIAEIENLFAHQFTTSSSGTSVFDFFDTAGNLLFNAGEAAIKFKLAQKAIKFALTAGAGIAALSIAGNIIYNVIQNNITPDYFAMAKEMGCEDSNGNVRYTILEPPIGAPDNVNNLFSFAMNPVVAGSRLASQGYIQTENAQPLGEGPDAEIIWYSMTHGHDPQNSISFKEYNDVADWDTNAKQGTNAGVFRLGSAMWDRRLNAINTGNANDQFNPRLRFHHSDNILAYKSEIDDQSYWEIANGYLQPNANSGNIQGKIQINSNNINLYEDVYISAGNSLNFIQSTKGKIAYDDSLKTLTFNNGDNDGEFIFNDYNNIARFKIDTTNNRIEIPQGSLFFQESSNQIINKVASTNLIFQMNSYDIITLNPPVSTWLGSFEYPVMTLQDSRLDGSSTARTETVFQMLSPNSTGQIYLKCSNGVNGDYTNVFYSRASGGAGNEYNYFFDTPKTKFNNIQLTDVGINLLNSGIEFSSNVGINALFWNGDIILTEDAPNIKNRITFLNTTLTNSGLESNGGNIYWNGSQLNNQSTGSSYFTDNGTLATSSNLDFTFTQDVEVQEFFTAGGNTNSFMRVDGNTVNNQTTILMAGGVRWIDYSRRAANEYLNFDFTSGTDSADNINFRLGATPSIKVKIQPNTTTIYNDLTIDTGNNLTLTQGNATLTQGDLTLTSGDIDCAGNWKIRSSNIATNVCNISQSDTTTSFSLAGGSSPDTFLFKDANTNDIFKAKTNDFRIFNSSGNTTFFSKSATTSIYNPLDVNEVYSRTGNALEMGIAGTSVFQINNTTTCEIPNADLNLSKGTGSTTNDSNFLFFGGTANWRVGMSIVPNVEFQALRFQYDYANQTKGGYILKSRNDAVITFTGQHKNAVQEEAGFVLQKGMLLSSTGKIRNFNEKDIITINETLPILKPTDKAKDKAVFGVWTGEKKKVNQYIQGSFGTECEPLIQDDTRCLINSTGEGAILICNEGGNVEIGDYICSSTKKGYGMKQDTDFNMNYTIAKATTAHTFTSNSKTALVGCIYML